VSDGSDGSDGLANDANDGLNGLGSDFGVFEKGKMLLYEGKKCVWVGCFTVDMV